MKRTLCVPHETTGLGPNVADAARGMRNGRDVDEVHIAGVFGNTFPELHEITPGREKEVRGWGRADRHCNIVSKEVDTFRRGPTPFCRSRGSIQN